MSNEKRKLLKKKLLLMALIILLFGKKSYDYKMYTPKYEILDTDLAFGRYSKGRVFIGSEKFICSLKDVCDDDILVIDERDSNDPNMSIIGSCNINDKHVRAEILQLLCLYEECNPSAWDRTLDSMKLEWFVHNLSYSLNHQIHRTQDVDLNNKDQRYYDNEILVKILGL